MRTDNPWKILSSRIAYKNPWMRVREDKVITPTGKEGIYGVMESNDSVMIVVVNNKDEVYLVRTFSYPDQSWNWEIPGGGGDKEAAIDASKRELEEETGILADTWQKLGETRVCNGLMTEKMSTYLARDLAFSGHKEKADEQISDTKFVSLSAIDTMIKDGEINDGQSITALYLFQSWYNQSK
ncbi:MAG TPA: NUDIX hydrolase [Patescibacteria group bacterium]|jgi:8-oxo-dGTP pyrophosphatase MutT (NUDIX family)|nr:NUDIX hydrolase [Patescibacteria group bacterium]